jgi:hypothetical protein
MSDRFLSVITEQFKIHAIRARAREDEMPMGELIESLYARNLIPESWLRYAEETDDPTVEKLDRQRGVIAASVAPRTVLAAEQIMLDELRRQGDESRYGGLITFTDALMNARNQADAFAILPVSGSSRCSWFAEYRLSPIWIASIKADLLGNPLDVITSNALKYCAMNAVLGPEWVQAIYRMGLAVAGLMVGERRKDQRFRWFVCVRDGLGFDPPWPTEANPNGHVLPRYPGDNGEFPRASSEDLAQQLSRGIQAWVREETRRAEGLPDDDPSDG